MKKSLFSKKSRPVIVFCSLLIGIGLLPLRIYYINQSHFQTSIQKNTKSIVISKSRGFIYDTNLNPFVYEEESTVSVVKPTVKALSALKKVLNSEQLDWVRDEIYKKNPVLLNIGNSISCADILTIPIYKRYNSKALASHIIGYLDDADAAGLSGVEKSYNEFLNEYNGELRIRFFADANGAYLKGTELQINNDNYLNKAGIVLTLDKHFQRAAEEAIDKSKIKKGAVVILDVKSGALRAMVSRPDFDRNNISNSISDVNMPLFNRALGAYAVGSVFKPLVAVAALEEGVKSSDKYICNGYFTANKNTFKCTSAHGNVNMASALAFSCNCYFINVIKKIGCEKVLDYCKVLGFGESLELASGISTYCGYLPRNEQLDSLASKALFSFGQGSLSANILQVASIYAAIASGGNYRVPYIFEGLVDESMEFISDTVIKPPYKVFSEESALKVSEFLNLAVREGTGQKAGVDNLGVCGKTATAQTGVFENGKEKLVTWFAGYYPYEKPEYVIVVMCEDGSSGAEDCAPVFSEIVKKILYIK